jgi:hypothetical protein
MTFEPVNIANIDASRQRAFRLTGGQLVVVQMTALEEANFLCLKVRCWLVNADGSPQVDSGGPVEIPAKVESLSLAALAEGQLNLLNEQARITAEALERMARWTVARAAWQTIPKEEPNP